MLARFAMAGAAAPMARAAEYRPGVCNIGAEEIARRRKAGHLGVLATLVVFAVLVAIDMPPLARLLVGLPAAGAASGYLQASLKFCAGFASRGIFNFGRLGEREQVQDAAARRLDRARATQIAVAALGIGVVVGLAAVLLPISA